MTEHFTCLARKTWANYWLKTWGRTARIELNGYICYLENICITGQPFTSKLVDEQPIRDELNIKGGKHVSACF